MHIADEPEIQEENNTSSDDGEKSDPNYQESRPHGTKWSGRQMGAAAAVVAMVLDSMMMRKKNMYNSPVSISL